MDLLKDKIINILYSYFPKSGNSETIIDYLNCTEEILEVLKENVYI